MSEVIQRFIDDDSGAVAIEYALIAVIVSVAIYGSVATIAPQLNSVFTKASSGLSTALAK